MLTVSILSGALALGLCPWISEIHSDSDPLEDSKGEFIEIVPGTGNMDSLYLELDGKAIASLPASKVASPPQRMVLCHPDSLRIIPAYTIPCQHLSATLPNTRATQWVLRQGFCRDTANLDAPKPGISFQRSGFPDTLDSWIAASPSPGFGNPLGEYDLWDLAPRIDSTVWDGARWTGYVGVDRIGEQYSSESLAISWCPLDSRRICEQDTLAPFAGTYLPVHSPLWPAVHLSVAVLGDETPLNNTLERILSPKDYPPLRISEIQAVPPSGSPEWIEIANQSDQSIPISAISICKPMAELDSTAQLAPGQHLVVTDSKIDLLAQHPSLTLSTVLESAHSLSLNNTADTIRICLFGQPIDSISWQKSPDSHTQKSPGWESAHPSTSAIPVLGSRFVTHGDRCPLRVSLPDSGTPWELELFTPEGLLLWRRSLLPSGLFSSVIPSSTPLGPALFIMKPANGKIVKKSILIVP